MSSRGHTQKRFVHAVSVHVLIMCVVLDCVDYVCMCVDLTCECLCLCTVTD